MALSWWADYHLHSSNSVDCSYELAVMANGALSRGLREIAVTDHADFDPADDGFEFYDYERYNRDLAAAREALSPPLTIRRALELGYQAEHHEEIVTFLAGKAYDFILGSVHFAGGYNVCDPPAWAAHIEGRHPADAYADYFEAVAATARSGLVDVLSHLDLCKRHATAVLGRLNYDDVADLVDIALRAAVENDVAIEINTSGLRQGPREPFPALDTLRRYVELGGEWITLGSDSHRPEHLAGGWEVAVGMARDTGVRWLATYEARHPILHRLP
ncbi:MAG: histidinol-phosphatase HisJ family protein [Ardenticatenaceae bacterium]|nr:histidinol-phosphatase HisJ family protein [Ardenticatenaceae bacterium]HBY98548.1 hypothetical protein [Chloroflexota bacterium]